MKQDPARNRRFASLLVFVVAVATCALPAAAQQPVRRAASEVAVGGATVAELAARQRALHTELTAVLPAGVSQAPVRVEITPKDREDLAAGAAETPMLVGVVKPLPESVGKPFGKAFNHGVTRTRADGSLVWALEVSSPGAQAIRLHFADVSLPADTDLSLIGPDGQADGPYVGAGRDGSGDFWSRSIEADTGTVVLRYRGDAPETALPKISFAISEIGHIRGRPPRAEPQSHDGWPCSDNAACVVDVNCVNTGPAAAAEDAVAKMEWVQGPFVYTCTGGLLADTDASTQIPYFLTANHCLSSSNASLETFFQYTTDSCDGTCPDGRVTGGSPPPASTVGATVAATGNAGDFTLLTLAESPPAGSVFLGWSNAPIFGINGANLYRVSNPNFGPQAYSQHEVAASGPECTGWPRGQRIYSVDLVGATMGGSSGSPVVNAAGEVVGQLSGCCGYNCGDVCDPSSNWTVDGALAYYWGSVAALLDPPAGCASDAECDDGLFCTGVETCSGGDCQAGVDPCSGGTQCDESADACIASACDNDGICEAGEDCGNCANDCRQKTGGNPNSRYCCDGDLTACGDSRCSESGWTCADGGTCTSDLECDDGQFCNGLETCSGSSCASGSDPCPGQGCDESGDQCVTCGGNKAACTTNGDCCSNNCRGGTCRGN